MSLAVTPYIPTYYDLNVSYASEAATGNATVHYVEAGSPNLPTIVLFHGFPSSGSVQYRDLIPLLALSYHVLAPDYPGFGLTKVADDFVYTFDNLATVIGAWLQVLNITSYAMYIHDYGAPVGLRLALKNPDQVKAIVSQNGNAYDAGFGQQSWAPIFALWNSSDSEEARQNFANMAFTLDATKEQYVTGTPSAELSLLDPQTWTINYLQNLVGTSNVQHQLDLFYDYRTNPGIYYPKFHEYFRTSEVPILAVWGKNDPAFIPAGAEAFKQDSPSAIVRFVDAGHFALENKRWEIARIMQQFLTSIGY